MATGEAIGAHGGPNAVELEALGVRYEALLDFSVSTNAYGPAPQMVDAIGAASLASYPEPTALVARRSLAEWLDVSERGVVIGNGAAELLWLVARTFLAPGDALVSVEPSFGELRRACLAVGARVVELRTRVEDAFALDDAALSALVAEAQPKLVALCAPSTPSGACVEIDRISRLAQRHADALWVIDQSFLSLSERHADRDTPLPGNVLVVRSLTKDHALPGVRVGYLVTTPRRAGLLERQRPAWSASALAQAAADIAPRLEDFVADSRRRLLEDRRELATALHALGIDTAPSHAAFLIARVGDAAELRRRMITEHRILVRDCASFGLPEHVRLSARPATDRARLIGALRQLRAVQP